MDRIYWSTGQFVLGAVSGTVAVSVFAIAIQLQGVYMMFSTAISSVFLPKVTGMVALNNDSSEISNLFIRTGRIQNIIMSFILFGFIVFGKPFIVLWAGDSYEDAYYMALAFFISLYIPLIQNLGITILQARNRMKFRSILYIFVAVFALIAEILLAKKWGGIGCAVSIAVALLIGQGLVMNIYYQTAQKIDIVSFWKEIFKMNFVPIIVSLVFLFAIPRLYSISSWSELLVGLILFSLVYIPLYVHFSMNEYERKLILKPILRIAKR